MFCLTASTLTLPVEVGGAWAAIVRDVGGVEMGGGGGSGGDGSRWWREVAQQVNVKGVSKVFLSSVESSSRLQARVGRGPVAPVRPRPIRDGPRTADRSMGEKQDAWHFRLPAT